MRAADKERKLQMDAARIMKATGNSSTTQLTQEDQPLVELDPVQLEPRRDH
jgi:hypothetical protein